VSLDAASTSQTDVVVQPSATDVQSFRVGAVVNATSANPITNLYGWQFSISYNASMFVPQGDPNALATSGNSLGLYPDGAISTVLFGSQISTGSSNWAGMIGANRGFGSSTTNSTNGLITIFFSMLNPNPPVGLSAQTLLANVGFEIIDKISAPQPLTITNVVFVDSSGTGIVGVVAGGGAVETMMNDPPHASFTTSPAHRVGPYALTFNSKASSDTDDKIPSPSGYFWDFGDTSQDLGLTGPIVTHNYTSAGPFNVTLRIKDSRGMTGAARDSQGNVIVNNQPSHFYQDPSGSNFPSSRGVMATGCISLAKAQATALSSSQFQQFAFSALFNYSSYGTSSDGAICRLVLFYSSSSSEGLEVVVNPDGTIMNIFHTLRAGLNSSGPNGIWSGYESQCTYCDPNNGNKILGAYMTFTVPTVYTPTSGAAQTSFGDCCWMSEWVGIGTASGGSDHHLFQAGVDKGTNNWGFRSNKMFIEELDPSLAGGDYSVNDIESPCPGGIRDGDLMGVRVAAYQVQSKYGSSTAFTYTFYDMNSQGLTKCVFEYDTNSNFGNVLSISPNWAYYIVESPSSIPNQGVPTCSGSTTLNYVCELPAREPAIAESAYFITRCCGTQPIGNGGSIGQWFLNQCVNTEPTFVNVQSSAFLNANSWKSYWVTSERQATSSANQCVPNFTFVPYPNPVVWYFRSAQPLSQVLYVNSVDGYSGTLTFGVSSSSSALSGSCPSYSLSANVPSASSPPGQIACSFQATSPGFYVVNITATSGSLVHWATMSMEVASYSFSGSQYFDSSKYLVQYSGIFQADSHGNLVGNITSTVLTLPSGQLLWQETKAANLTSSEYIDVMAVGPYWLSARCVIGFCIVTRTADINHDAGMINIVDLSAVAACFGSTSSCTTFNSCPNCPGNTTADITGPSGDPDGQVNIFDMTAIAFSFGEQVVPP